MAWVALSIAVLANVVANLSLKVAARGASGETASSRLFAFLAQPWTWVGIGAAILLLVCYLIAIREIGLGVAYASVTSVALVLITVSASFILGERLTLMTILGMALVILGIAILVRAEIAG